MVAESIVIFGPIFQRGCFKASDGLIDLKFFLRTRKGPPDDVKINFFTVSGLCPSRHCQRAECSLSTGKMAAPERAASLRSNRPAITRGSLLAIAASLPARTAAKS